MSRLQSELVLHIEQGNLDRVCNLIPHVNLEQKNQTGYTPLAIAVRAGHLKISEEIIKQGANINAINDVIITIVGRAKCLVYCLLA